MGMYTELHFNARLKTDIPPEVVAVLRWMCDGGEPVATPDHPLFRTPRWSALFTCDSYYFDADTHSTLRYDDIAKAYYLCVRANIKNYDGEIQHFIDWIMPYLDKSPGDFLGFHRYEESETPTLIHYPEEPPHA